MAISFNTNKQHYVCIFKCSIFNFRILRYHTSPDHGKAICLFFLSLPTIMRSMEEDSFMHIQHMFEKLQWFFSNIFRFLYKFVHYLLSQAFLLLLYFFVSFWLHEMHSLNSWYEIVMRKKLIFAIVRYSWCIYNILRSKFSKLISFCSSFFEIF